MAFNNPFETKTTTTAPEKAMDKGDIEEFLSSDDKDDKPEPKDDKPKEELETKVDDKEDEDDEDKIELKDDEDDDDEDKLDLKDDDKESDDKVDAPPKRKEILAKYPKFFEEFPFVEKMLYRDKQYTELFGGFDNAKEAASRVEILNNFEQQLRVGKTSGILKEVKDNDPKAFDKIVDGYLESLKEVDKDAWLDVVGNLGKSIVQGMIQEAKRSESKELHDSAKELYKYLFATSEWEDIKLRAPAEKDVKDNELEKERAEFQRERFEQVRDSLQTKVDNILTSTISEHIDPRGLMSNFEKKNAIKDALDLLHTKLSTDKELRNNLDRLWRNAFANKYSTDTVDSIRRTYLGKSKGLLASVIKEIRKEVLKDSTGRKPKEEETETTTRERKPLNAGRPSQQTTKANERKTGESVAEFFMRD
jgi:hypothetical protein